MHSIVKLLNADPLFVFFQLCIFFVWLLNADAIVCLLADDARGMQQAVNCRPARVRLRGMKAANTKELNTGRAHSRQGQMRIFHFQSVFHICIS